ncbi:MAG: AraC family transcriptional regulator [Pseudomonadota bacterium]
MVDRAFKEPLAAQRLFRTTELDEARAIVAGKFCDHRLNIVAAPDHFDACHHRAEGQVASLNYIRYGADVEIEPGELESFYLIQIPLSGHAAIDNGGGVLDTGKGLGSVLNPHRDTKMRWHDGCAQLLLQIDTDALQREAERLTGTAISTPVTFETAVDETRSPTAAWVCKLKTCFGLAERRAVFAGAPSNTQTWVEMQLITDFLRSQPSNISALIEMAPKTAANKHLKRALAYILSNLREPIRLDDIAEAAGTSARSLQLCFRAELGQTPMQYLKRQRLGLARSMIQTAKANEAIGDIVHKAGFSHFGRFSADYREEFGELPSQTNQHPRKLPQI